MNHIASARDIDSLRMVCSGHLFLSLMLLPLQCRLIGSLGWRKADHSKVASHEFLSSRFLSSSHHRISLAGEWLFAFSICLLLLAWSIPLSGGVTIEETWSETQGWVVTRYEDEAQPVRWFISSASAALAVLGLGLIAFSLIAWKRRNNQLI